METTKTSQHDTPRMAVVRWALVALTLTTIVSPAVFAWWWAATDGTWRHVVAFVMSLASVVLLGAFLQMSLDAARKSMAEGGER